MKHFLLCLLALLPLLSSCQSLRNYRLADEFNDSSRGYISMVRWHELDRIAPTYVDNSLWDEYQRRAVADGDVQVVDYRVRDVECNPVTGVATVTMEWDYYIPPSATVKTLVDLQKWAYREDAGRGRWVLQTLLPKFK